MLFWPLEGSKTPIIIPVWNRAIETCDFSGRNVVKTNENIFSNDFSQLWLKNDRCRNNLRVLLCIKEENYPRIYSFNLGVFRVAKIKHSFPHPNPKPKPSPNTNRADGVSQACWIFWWQARSGPDCSYSFLFPLQPHSRWSVPFKSVQHQTDYFDFVYLTLF